MVADRLNAAWTPSESPVSWYRVELSLKHGLAVLVALNPEGDTVERILEAAENCPVSAITVENAEKVVPPGWNLASTQYMRDI